MDQLEEYSCCKKIVSNYHLNPFQCFGQQERQQMKKMHPNLMEEDEQQEETEEQQFQKQLKYGKLANKQKKMNNGQPLREQYPLGFGTQQKKENQDKSQDKMDEEGQEESLKKQENVEGYFQQKPNREEDQDDTLNEPKIKDFSGVNDINGRNSKENTSNEQNDEIKCPNCNKLLTFETLGNHIETCENREEPCQFCEKWFPTFLLQEHLDVCEKAPSADQQQSARRQNFIRRRQPSIDREEEEEGQFENNSERNYAGEHESEEEDEDEDEEDEEEEGELGSIRMLLGLGDRRHNTGESRVERDNSNSSSPQQREDRAARNRALNNNPSREISPDQGTNIDQELKRLFLLRRLLEQLNNHDPSNNGGLKAHQINNFPEHVFHNQDGLNPDQSKCTICQSDYEENDNVKVLYCLHSYHSNCIDVWLKKNSQCPVCKKDMKEFE